MLPLWRLLRLKATRFGESFRPWLLATSSRVLPDFTRVARKCKSPKICTSIEMWPYNPSLRNLREEAVHFVKGDVGQGWCSCCGALSRRGKRGFARNDEANIRNRSPQLRRKQPAAAALPKRDNQVLLWRQSQTGGLPRAARGSMTPYQRKPVSMYTTTLPEFPPGVPSHGQRLRTQS